MPRPLLCLLFTLCSGILAAQSLWSDVSGRPEAISGERRIVPRQYRTARLDLAGMEALLAQAPVRFAPDAPDAAIVLSLPLPDGGTGRFRLQESPVMAPGLQDRFPETRCYTGVGLDDPYATLKCDLTPWGFHAMMLSPQHSPVFIDPYAHGDRDFYVVYFKKDLRSSRQDEPFSCQTEDDAEELKPDEALPEFQGDCKLRRYRLAMAATGEYTQFHGGTKALALAALNTTMNRINGLYERDFAVTMELVPNNDAIIYVDAAADPYSTSVFSMVDENVTTLNALIGLNNYDIGHVVGAGGGGGYGPGRTCTTNKARGATSLSSPVGDPFDIDYVAHEMGHQFSASHTQNGECNRVNGASMEPGSGTTIMGYAGVCSPWNVQPHSDDHFHAYSIQQVGLYVTTGSGNTCAVKITTGNNGPTVNAGPDFSIPRNTPFVLIATGSDPDGDPLTYNWEQMDPEFAVNPPVSNSAIGPLFRSFGPVASPQRVFPRLADVVNNVAPVWEVLPDVARLLKFRVTARDNFPDAGCTAEDDLTVTVAAGAGPFRVTDPNLPVQWIAGETRTVAWDVANTTAAPVSTASVRITLSTDGGYTYPIELAAAVPNTGAAAVTVPNIGSTTARVRIEAVGNIFFDISDQDFTIMLPTFDLTVAPIQAEICAGGSAVYQLQTGAVGGFSQPVDLTLSGAPAGATVSFFPNPLTPGGSATLTVGGLTPAMAGTYQMTVTATAGAQVRSADIALTVQAAVPPPPVLAGPADGATGVSSAPTLTWLGGPAAFAYLVEVATQWNFSAPSVIIADSTVSNSFQAGGLQAGTVYYWRVRAGNACGQSQFSEVHTFQAGLPECNQVFASAAVPVAIPESPAGTVVSTLDVAAGGSIDAVAVSLEIAHTWIGDLDAWLVSPAGDSLLLFDRPGLPTVDADYGCDGDDLDLVFDDAATQTSAALESTCGAALPVLQGAYQPVDPLNVLTGQSPQGQWKLYVSDYVAPDGGALNAWSLNFCLSNPVPSAELLHNLPLTVAYGSSTSIPPANLALDLSATPAEGVFTLRSLPLHGSLQLNGTDLNAGDTFTQASIDAGLLVYIHNGDGAITDDFHFDVQDQSNDGWLFDQVFSLVIVQNTLTVTASVSQPVLCHNGLDGAVTAVAAGLTGPFNFSLNGGAPQSSPVFTGLGAGSYVVVATGAFGFTATANTVVLDNPPALAITASVDADDIGITASGGTGILEYSLNGVDFQGSPLFSNQANGIYTVVARDANGCTASAEAIVSVDALLATMALENPVSCFGAADGAIAVTAAGGISPLEFSLNGGPFQVQGLFTGLAAGNYTATVRDAQGFTVTTSALTLDNPAELIVGTTVLFNTIAVAAFGGTGSLEYSLDGQNFQPGAQFTGLSNGTYTITVRDANGCTAAAAAVVDVAPLQIIVVNIIPALCFGDSVTLTVQATGGIPPYEYRLNSGSWQAGNVFQVAATALIVVEARDASGVTAATPNIAISQPNPLVPTVNIVGNDVAFSAMGGTPPYTYFLNGIPVGTNVTDLPNGTYTQTVRDVNGCEVEQTFTIDVANPPLTATVNVVMPLCNGGSDGSIMVLPAGGEAPYTFALNNSPVQPSPVFASLPAGAYTVYAFDANGEMVQLTVDLTEPDLLEAEVSIDPGSVTITATGGTAPYSYSLDGGTAQSSPVFEGLGAGLHTIVVTDANGCTATILVTVSGVHSPEAAWGVQVWPNPGPGIFQLRLENAPANLRVEVVDVAGRVLHRLEYRPAGGSFDTRLDLTDLPQGMYILRLSDGTGTVSLRLGKTGN